MKTIQDAVLNAIREDYGSRLAYLGERGEFDDCDGELAFNAESAFFSKNDYALHPSDSGYSFCLLFGSKVYEITFGLLDGNEVYEAVKAIIERLG